VEEAAIAAVDIAAGWSLETWRFRRPECESAVRSLAVVVLDVDAQDLFEVATAEDQQVVETLLNKKERGRVRRAAANP
jgi:hypothetical protein